jgi:lipopolysaccharide/colanic/teichoic acid biosynthesis glycosyltransferase
VGRDGRHFQLLAFRSTQVDAGSGLHEDVDDWWAQLRPAPETTPLGAVLRRYSIDELPQLFNVLRGEMSLVGPRPGLPSEVPHVGASRSFPVKPGLTGLAPASQDRFPDDGRRLDTDYAENWSLVLDLWILRKTFAAALRGDGAR